MHPRLDDPTLLATLKMCVAEIEARLAGPAMGAPAIGRAPEPEPEREVLIDAAEVMRRTGFSPATLHRKIAAGAFPAPTYVGRRKRWAASVIDDWFALVADAAGEMPADLARRADALHHARTAARARRSGDDVLGV